MVLRTRLGQDQRIGLAWTRTATFGRAKVVGRSITDIGRILYTDMATRFSASLRVFHGTMTAADIVAIVGMDAKIAQSVGDRRRTPKGNPLDGEYTKTYVSFPLFAEQFNSIEELLKSLCDSGHLSDTAITKIVGTGGTVEVFIGLFCDGSCGIVRDPSAVVHDFACK